MFFNPISNFFSSLSNRLGRAVFILTLFHENNIVACSGFITTLLFGLFLHTQGIAQNCPDRTSYQNSLCYEESRFMLDPLVNQYPHMGTSSNENSNLTGLTAIAVNPGTNNCLNQNGQLYTQIDRFTNTFC
jgi:hypothetical protein